MAYLGPLLMMWLAVCWGSPHRHLDVEIQLLFVHSELKRPITQRKLFSVTHFFLSRVGPIIESIFFIFFVSTNYYLTVVETFVCLHDLKSCTGWR